MPTDERNKIFGEGTDSMLDPQAEPKEPETEPKEPETPEPKKATTPDGGGEPKEKEPSIQELLVRIAKLEREKNKSDAEASEWKKKFRATQSEKEVIDAEKAEAQAAKEAEFEDMKRSLKIHDLTEQYVRLKYPVDLAKAAAVAEVDNDTETRFKIQQQVQQAQLAEAEAEWLKSRPQIQAGSGEDEEDPFLKGFSSVKIG